MALNYAFYCSTFAASGTATRFSFFVFEWDVIAAFLSRLLSELPCTVKMSIILYATHRVSSHHELGDMRVGKVLEFVVLDAWMGGCSLF